MSFNYVGFNSRPKKSGHAFLLFSRGSCARDALAADAHGQIQQTAPQTARWLDLIVGRARWRRRCPG